MVTMHSAKDASFWRFDALDALAGMAFVSRAGVDGDDQEVVCFRPPAFQPEPIGRSSLALGATRGSFQGGLLIEGAEARFSSLAAAGEFVRRAYVRGSAGDGGGAPRGGGGPQNLGPDLPRPRREDSEQSSQESALDPSPALSALMGDMARFRESIAKCEFGDTYPMMWTRTLTSDANAGAGDIMLNGAAHLLRDIVDRWSSVLSDDLRRAIWRFGTTVWTLGIEPYELIKHIERFSPDYFKSFSFNLRGELEDFRFYSWENLYNRDPLDVLSQLATSADFVAAPRPNDLLAWLSRFLATPNDALDSISPREGIERATFAAAVIVNRRDVWPHWYDADERLATFRDLESSALAWLWEHLPQMAYCSAFESALVAMEEQRQV